jgi:hypothetical protein
LDWVPYKMTVAISLDLNPRSLISEWKEPLFQTMTLTELIDRRPFVKLPAIVWVLVEWFAYDSEMNRIIQLKALNVSKVWFASEHSRGVASSLYWVVAITTIVHCVVAVRTDFLRIASVLTFVSIDLKLDLLLFWASATSRPVLVSLFDEACKFRCNGVTSLVCSIKL